MRGQQDAYFQKMGVNPEEEEDMGDIRVGDGDVNYYYPVPQQPQQNSGNSLLPWALLAALAGGVLGYAIKESPTFTDTDTNTDTVVEFEFDE